MDAPGGTAVPFSGGCERQRARGQYAAARQQRAGACGYTDYGPGNDGVTDYRHGNTDYDLTMMTMAQQLRG